MGKMFIYLSGHTSSPKINRTKIKPRKLRTKLTYFTTYRGTKILRVTMKFLQVLWILWIVLGAQK